MKINIYVVSHKPFRKPSDDIYIPILAGAASHDRDKYVHFVFDDDGENISEKHALYAEYTALYWMWKNADCDFIGENHYRRYFIRGGWVTYFMCFLFSRKPVNYALSRSDIEKIFAKGCNCILPKKQVHPGNTMEELYCSSRKDGVRIFSDIRRIVLKKYPEYAGDLESMLNERKSYFKCIHIMSKNLFDEMAAWIFSIFDELEKLDVRYEDREFAYVGEWMSGVWYRHNIANGKLRVKECFYINTECTAGRKHYVWHETIWPAGIAAAVQMTAGPLAAFLRKTKAKIKNRRK